MRHTSSDRWCQNGCPSFKYVCFTSGLYNDLMHFGAISVLFNPAVWQLLYWVSFGPLRNLQEERISNTCYTLHKCFKSTQVGHVPSHTSSRWSQGRRMSRARHSKQTPPGHVWSPCGQRCSISTRNSRSNLISLHFGDLWSHPRSLDPRSIPEPCILGMVPQFYVSSSLTSRLALDNTLDNTRITGG